MDVVTTIGWKLMLENEVNSLKTVQILTKIIQFNSS